MGLDGVFCRLLVRLGAVLVRRQEEEGPKALLSKREAPRGVTVARMRRIGAPGR